jgi:phosphoglycolate phosphatase
VVTDLDNTLWDWFVPWYESFSAMLDRLSEMSGVPQGVLETEIRAVHQLRGTSEYSNLLNELPSLIARSGNSTPLEVYDDAVHVLHKTRKSATALYPKVKQTLEKIRASGVTVAAYTESLAYWTEWRIKHTELDGIIQYLYSAPDHDLPAGTTFEQLRRRPSDEYGLKLTSHRHVPRGEVKPNPDILASILKDLSCEPADAVYVGDSLLKDVQMAQQAGVVDIHAAYGEAQSKPEYELLRRVSHWPDEVVSQEKQLLRDPVIKPTVTLGQGFYEILQHLELGKVE